jgi:hypothetical protein
MNDTCLEQLVRLSVMTFIKCLNKSRTKNICWQQIFIKNFEYFPQNLPNVICVNTVL